MGELLYFLKQNWWLLLVFVVLLAYLAGRSAGMRSRGEDASRR